MATRTFRHLMAVFGMLSLSGCASHIGSSQEVYDGTRFSYDKYSARTVVRGQDMLDIGMFEHQTKSLATSLDSNGNVDTTWIDLTEEVRGYLNLFVTAHDDRALPLQVEKLERHPDRADFSYENVAIHLPPGYLAAHAATGIDVQIEGRHGTATTTIPALYVQGYLQKLQQVQSCVKMKTC